MTSMKSKPMTKDEVAAMLELIQREPHITSKQTNATSNKHKDEAWKVLTESFNARGINTIRKMEQLKLKWDNLKKAARRRSHQIRMNSLKTGGGKSEYIPPDEILDQVASMLGTTCTGYEVEFGGDGQSADVHNDIIVGSFANEYADVILDAPFATAPEEQSNEPETPKSASNSQPPIAKNLYTYKRKAMKRKDDNSRTKRDEAIAEYYLAKKKKIEAEQEKINLEILLLKKQLEK